MKQLINELNFFTRLRLILACVTLCFVFLAQCQKEHETITGEWQTVSAIGYHYDYTISEGSVCWALPSSFPDTAFCSSYSQKKDTVFIFENRIDGTVHLRKWLWKWIGEDAADITNLNHERLDREAQRFIIVRNSQ